MLVLLVKEAPAPIALVARKGFESRKIDQGRIHMNRCLLGLVAVLYAGRNPLCTKGYRAFQISGEGVHKLRFLVLVSACRLPIYSPTTGSFHRSLPPPGAVRSFPTHSRGRDVGMGLLHRCGYVCGEA